MIWAVVMAGGMGTRFWPASRRRRPKQVLPLLGRSTLIQDTVERLKPFISEKRILIITNSFQKPILRKILKKIPDRNFITEPCSRNTAPCLMLAAFHIEKRDPNAIFIALPADHQIGNSKSFRNHLKVACKLALKDKHVVFGIPPTRPHTGFGYIACGDIIGREDGVEIYRGSKFVEKPSLARAKAFLRSRKYFWNSGMFVWKLSFFLRSVERILPHLSRKLHKVKPYVGTQREKLILRKVFPSCPPISIDYALMEKVRDLCVVKAGFDWSDVGSWEELENLLGSDRWGNVLQGKVVTLESWDNVVRAGKERLVSLLGVKNLIVVDTEDALLICQKGKAQEVKKLVEMLHRRKFDAYL